MQKLLAVSASHIVPVLLRLTIRPTYWRIAVLLPGRILWRTYSREAYPEPEAAVRRCLEGLATRIEPQEEARRCPENRKHQDIFHDNSLHQQHGQKQCQNHCANRRHDSHSTPPSGPPAPEGHNAERDHNHVHAGVQEGVKHGLYSYCSEAEPDCPAEKNSAYEKGDRSGRRLFFQPHGGDEERGDKKDAGYRAQNGFIRHFEPPFPHPQRPLRLRAAWWGWL